MAVELAQFEGVKENIVPLRGGRDPKALVKAVAPTVDLEPERKRHEKDIAEYDGCDPLEPWVAFITWTQQAYASGGLDQELIPLLEKCTRTFKDTEMYRNDPRYIKIWMTYASKVDDPRDIYSYLETNGIGTNLGLFYESWAAFRENIRDFAGADQVFQLAINRRAQPMERLKRLYGDLQVRWNKYKAEEADRAQYAEPDDVRHALNRLSSKSQTDRSVVRKTGTLKASKDTMPIAEPRSNTARGGFTVFEDGDAAPAPVAPQRWNHLASENDRHKENSAQATTWTTQSIRQDAQPNATMVGERVVALIRNPNRAKFELYEDEPEADAAPARPTPAPAATLRAQLDGNNEVDDLRNNPLRNFEIRPAAAAPAATSTSSSRPALGAAGASSKVAATSKPTASAPAPAAAASAQDEDGKKTNSKLMYTVAVHDSDGRDISFEETRRSIYMRREALREAEQRAAAEAQAREEQARLMRAEQQRLEALARERERQQAEAEAMAHEQRDRAEQEARQATERRRLEDEARMRAARVSPAVQQHKPKPFAVHEDVDGSFVRPGSHRAVSPQEPVAAKADSLALITKRLEFTNDDDSVHTEDHTDSFPVGGVAFPLRSSLTPGEEAAARDRRANAASARKPPRPKTPGRGAIEDITLGVSGAVFGGRATPGQPSPTLNTKLAMAEVNDMFNGSFSGSERDSPAGRAFGNLLQGGPGLGGRIQDDVTEDIPVQLIKSKSGGFTIFKDETGDYTQQVRAAAAAAQTAPVATNNNSFSVFSNQEQLNTVRKPEPASVFGTSTSVRKPFAVMEDAPSAPAPTPLAARPLGVLAEASSTVRKPFAVFEEPATPAYAPAALERSHSGNSLMGPPPTKRVLGEVAVAATPAAPSLGASARKLTKGEIIQQALGGAATLTRADSFKGAGQAANESLVFPTPQGKFALDLYSETPLNSTVQPREKRPFSVLDESAIHAPTDENVDENGVAGNKAGKPRPSFSVYSDFPPVTPISASAPKARAAQNDSLYVTPAAAATSTLVTRPAPAPQQPALKPAFTIFEDADTVSPLRNPTRASTGGAAPALDSDLGDLNVSTPSSSASNSTGQRNPSLGGGSNSLGTPFGQRRTSAGNNTTLQRSAVLSPSLALGGAALNGPEVNPFIGAQHDADKAYARALLEKLVGTDMFEDHGDESAPPARKLATPGTTIMLGVRLFTTERQLGKGAFAEVFLVNDADPTLLDAVPYALKVERPANYWEAYIGSQIDQRITSDMVGNYVAPTSLHLFEDGTMSCSLMEASLSGSLQDAVNCMAKDGKKGLEEPLVAFYAIELLRSVAALHAAGLLHGDIKPDNVLLRNDEFEGLGPWQPSHQGGWASKGLRLIDFGRAIDMRIHPIGAKYIGDCAAEQFQCPEMQLGLPWKHQIDNFAIAGVIHTLLHGEYMDAVTAPSGRYRPRLPVKRYWAPHWEPLLDALMNSDDVTGATVLGEQAAVLEQWLLASRDRPGSVKMALVRLTNRMEAFLA